MAFAHGRLGGFSIKDATTTWRNISTYLNGVDFSEAADTDDVTTFNTTGKAKVYVPGNKDATIGLDGPWDPTVDGYLHGILGVSKAFTYYPNTTASANTNFVRYSGSVILNKYDTKTGIGGAVTYSGGAQVTGKITRSTASS